MGTAVISNTAARTAASASARLVTSSLTASRSFDCPKALDTALLEEHYQVTQVPAEAIEPPAEHKIEFPAAGISHEPIEARPAVLRA